MSYTTLIILKPRINNLITAPELRVIAEDGKNLGVLSLGEALKLARPDSGIDLIEIAPNAKPPVARLMNYDKYRYQEEKALKKERSAQKAAGSKQIQISAKEAKNDLVRKEQRIAEFLKEGHQVEIQLFLRGREKYNKDWARKKMDEFLKMITSEHKVLSTPRFGGRGMTAQIAPK